MGLELLVPLAALQRTLSLAVTQAPLDLDWLRACVRARRANKVVVVARGVEAPAAVSKSTIGEVDVRFRRDGRDCLSIPSLLRQLPTRGILGQFPYFPFEEVEKVVQRRSSEIARFLIFRRRVSKN